MSAFVTICLNDKNADYFFQLGLDAPRCTEKVIHHMCYLILDEILLLLQQRTAVIDHFDHQIVCSFPVTRIHCDLINRKGIALLCMKSPLIVGATQTFELNPGLSFNYNVMNSCQSIAKPCLQKQPISSIIRHETYCRLRIHHCREGKENFYCPETSKGTHQTVGFKFRLSSYQQDASLFALPCTRYAIRCYQKKSQKSIDTHQTIIIFAHDNLIKRY